MTLDSIKVRFWKDVDTKRIEVQRRHPAICNSSFTLLLVYVSTTSAIIFHHSVQYPTVCTYACI